MILNLLGDSKYVCGVQINGFGLCGGDSGGPMVCKDKKGRAVLQGVVSGPGYDGTESKGQRPSEDCQEVKHAKFANVHKYVKFIKRHSLVWFPFSP